MNWDKETVVRFLELYQMNPCIWDPGNEGHKNRQRVNDAWNTIKDNLGVPCTLQDLKKRRSRLCLRTEDEELTINEDQNTEQGPIDQNIRSQEQQELNSNEQQGSTARPILHRRRQNNPPELIEAKKRMDEAYSFMKQHSQLQLKDEDDECSTFGVLVARKLRKLSEQRRDIMMAKIHELFVDEHVYNFNLPNYSSSRPNSAATMLSYTPSPPQINIASPSAVASSPKVAYPTDVASLNSATSQPNSDATMLSYTPSPPQSNIASPPQVAFPTEVEYLNCVNSYPNSTKVLYTSSSPQMDAPSPAYHVEYSEYSNDTPLNLPNPTSRMVSYTPSPSQIPRGKNN
ncbi:unnamed protein product [Parnassius apollo]|uniref:(apollo) hypothetical protein n=1 Tax=Parnassius apollo TaxID=110799 RepID=A0A8S3XNN8_PARAO|nr:unnamed protein product [Parnassius apollo]CAG5035794.1 unnamed protein product [Parnassius apollo]CAG5046033.1 unnamed protein product [Parnassius apollo]CAG5047100.1 unnamed protein product [Parnassius apollo]